MSTEVVSYDDSSPAFAFDPPVTCVNPAVWCPNTWIKRTRKSKYFNATAHTAFCGNCSVSLSWTGGSSVAVYTRINYPGCANVIYTLDGHDTLAVQCRGADDAFRQRVFVACVRPGFVLANDTQQ